jgi:hypothetical protein
MLGHVACTDMSSAFHRQIRDWRFITLLAVGIMVGYVVTVGMVPAIVRHTGSGGLFRLLPSVPGAVAALSAYAWLAQQLSRVRALHPVFGLSAEFWCSVLDPPDTTP